jgi:hypothetical protein
MIIFSVKRKRLPVFSGQPFARLSLPVFMRANHTLSESGS